MRHDEDQMRQLGDMPSDWGTSHTPRLDSKIGMRPSGYRPMPVNQALQQKFQAEMNSGMDYLLKLREANECTAFTSMQHPMHDTPYFGRDIHYSSGIQAVTASTTDSALTVISILEQRHVCFIRNLTVITYDANADADIDITVRVNGFVTQADYRVPPSAFMSHRNNSYYKILGGQSFDILITNNSTTLSHDVLIQCHGWEYTVSGVSDTPRGTMPTACP